MNLDDGGFLFRNVPDDNIQGIAMAHYLRQVRQPAVDSVAVVFEDTPYGNGLKGAFIGAFTRSPPCPAMVIASSRSCLEALRARNADGKTRWPSLKIVTEKSPRG